MAKTHVGILEVDRETSLPNLRSTKGGFGFEGTTPKYWNGSSWSAFSGSGSGINTWDELYDADKALTIDETTGITWTITAVSGDAFTLVAGATATGDLLQFNNGGSGSDIKGTSDTWSISKAGAIVATALTMGDDESITLGASSDATIDWDSVANLLDIGGAVNFENNVALEASATIVQAGLAGSTVFTITAGDALVSDGSLAITDADNAATFSVTNATVTTANTVAITADAATSGSILYIDNGGASLDTGFYINCNDDGTSDFTVGKDGATTITTAVNSTKALVVTGVQTSETLVNFDNTTGVIASDKAVLLLDAGGNVADGGNILRIAPTGTPVAGSIGIEFVGASKVMQGLYIDADPTASSAAVINGGGALTNGYAVLHVSSDGNLASGGNTFKVTTAGTPASGAMYAEFDFTGITDTNENVGVKIDAGGKKVIGLYVDADPIANSAVYFTSGAALAADKATLEVVSVPTTNNADSAVLRLEQTHTAGGSNMLHMVQNDVDKPFIGFETTIGVGNAIEAAGGKSLTATHYVMVDIEGVGPLYIATGTIA